MGGAWKMPTYEQCEELLKYTTYRQIEVNSIKGVLLTSTINYNTVFFPFSGAWYGSYKYHQYNSAGTFGFIWTSNKHVLKKSKGWGLYFDSDGVVDLCMDDLLHAYPIRPIFVK